MQPDEARLQDVHGWLSKAALDLKAAAHGASGPAERLWGDVMFHAQQATEKAMKAFLAWHDVPFRKTHNLEELGRQCAALDATLGPVADEATPLTEYAWRFRYPGESGEPDRAEAEAALAVARNVYSAIGQPVAAGRASRKPELRPFRPGRGCAARLESTTLDACWPWRCWS